MLQVVNRALQFLYLLLEGGELSCHVVAQLVLADGHRFISFLYLFYLSHYCLEVRLDGSFVL